MSERVMKALANCEQGLSEEQKLQARTNIGAIGGVKVTDSSGTTELVPDANGKVTVDLTNAGKTQSDWDEENPVEPSFIRNKPDLSIYARRDEIEKGVFVGVYTGNDFFSTPYADYKSAWDDGKAVFLSYGIDDTSVILPLTAIDDVAAVFTRTMGEVSGNAYVDVSNFMVKVSAETDAYSFYTKALDSQEQANWTEADPLAKSFIRNKPTLSEVATTGSYNSLTDKPTIPSEQINSDWTEQDETKKSFILHKPNLASVATTGSYNSLTDKPTIPAAQVQSDWTQTNSSDPSFIRHKPTLSTVAVSGSYNDLTDKPDIPSQQEQADWTEQDSDSPSYIKHKPAIPSAQIQSDWNQSDSSQVDFIKNKPTLSAVATSGNYSDLNGKPTIPAAQIQSDWNQSDSSQVDFIKNKPAQMQTKPLVPGTNMEFVVGADSVTLNATSNVFVATYGTTTWNEVKAAYDADKVIVLDGANFGTNVHTQMVLYNYSTPSGATQKFLFAPTFYRVSAAQTSYWAQLDENDGWSSGYRTGHFPNVNAGVKQLSGDETFTALVEHRGWLCNRVGFFNIGYFSSASACTVYIEAVNGGFTFDLVGMKRTIRNDLKAAIDLTTTVQSLVTSIDVQTRVVSTGNTINSSSSPRYTLFTLGPQEQSNYDTDIIYEVQLLDSTNGRSYLLKVEKFGVPSTSHNYICATLAGGDLL